MRNHLFLESVSVDLLATVLDNGRTHNIDANMCRRAVAEHQSKHAQNIISLQREGNAHAIQCCLYGSVVLEPTPLCSNSSSSRLLSLAALAAATP